jgi:hypothetical protein
MRKFKASMEPFWDGKYVEYLTPISSEYLISCELLSLTSTAGRTSRVFLAYVIPWINKASLELYIARRHRAACHDRRIWSLEAVLRCRIRPCGWSIETYHYRDRESVSDWVTPFCDWGATVYSCVRTILTTFYHMHHYHYAATGDMVKSFISNNFCGSR